jgi:hypothetical protein
MPIQRNNDEERADRMDRLVNEHPTNTAPDGATSQEPVGAAPPAEAWVRPSGPRTTKMRPVSPSATEVIVGAVVIVGLPAAQFPAIAPRRSRSMTRTWARTHQARSTQAA